VISGRETWRLMSCGVLQRAIRNSMGGKDETKLANIFFCRVRKPVICGEGGKGITSSLKMGPKERTSKGRVLFGNNGGRGVM